MKHLIFEVAARIGNKYMGETDLLRSQIASIREKLPKKDKEAIGLAFEDDGTPKPGDFFNPALALALNHLVTRVEAGLKYSSQLRPSFRQMSSPVPHGESWLEIEINDGLYFVNVRNIMSFTVVEVLEASLALQRGPVRLTVQYKGEIMLDGKRILLQTIGFYMSKEAAMLAARELLGSMGMHILDPNSL